MEQVQVRQPNLVANWRHVMRTCNPPKELDPVSRWLVLTRACVQPMTLTAAAFAGLLAVRAPRFNLGLWLLASLGIVLAHASNNLMNDLFDLEVGSDTRDYPRALYAPQAVLSGLITRRGLIRAALVINLTDLVILAVLALLRGPLVIFFALSGLLISVGYAAPPLRLKQHGLGEPASEPDAVAKTPRLALAHWLTSGKHPLTVRFTVCGLPLVTAVEMALVPVEFWLSSRLVGLALMEKSFGGTVRVTVVE